MNKQNISLIQNNNLQCVRTPSGQYTLNIRNTNGRMHRIKSIGFSSQPFEIVAQFQNTPMIAVRRSIMTPQGTESRLYLVNCESGIIDERTANGVASISYNPIDRQFYFLKEPVKNNVQTLTSNVLLLWLLMQNQIDAALMQRLLQNPIALQTIDAATNGIAINTIARPIRRRKLRNRKKLRARAKRIRTTRKNARIAKPRTKKSALHATLNAPYSLKPIQNIKYGAQKINTSNAHINNTHRKNAFMKKYLIQTMQMQR